MAFSVATFVYIYVTIWVGNPRATALPLSFNSIKILLFAVEFFVHCWIFVLAEAYTANNQTKELTAKKGEIVGVDNYVLRCVWGTFVV